MLRWFKAGCFEAIVQDLRMLLRLADGRSPHPSAAILDSRALQSTPGRGIRAGYDGAKRRKGSKVHLAVDTLGHLLDLHVTPANEQDRDQVGRLAEAIQEVSDRPCRPRLHRGKSSQRCRHKRAVSTETFSSLTISRLFLPSAASKIIRPRIAFC